MQTKSLKHSQNLFKYFSWLTVIALMSASPLAQADDTDTSTPITDTAAPEPPPPAPVEIVPGETGIRMSLILRGGVSLGAYEAGYLYYITELLKKNPGLFDTRVITGASAGGINTLITAIELGRAAQPNPQESLFSNVWTALSYKNLLDASHPDTIPGSMSSGNELKKAAEKVWQVWKNGLREDYEVVVGFTATRIKPYDVEITPGLDIKRQAEKFVVRIKGRGIGKPPEVTNYIYLKNNLFQPLLPFKQYDSCKNDWERHDADRRNFDAIISVVMASAAFPVAFPPVRISYCVREKTDNAQSAECETPTHSGYFVDGGVFDNNPLRLASQIASALNADEKGIRGTASEGDFADDYLFLYLDPDYAAYPIKQKEEETAENSEGGGEGIDILTYIPQFLGSFIDSARSAEMNAFIEENPEARDHVKLTPRYYPTVSNAMGAFMGFFDRQFLHYDFYLGMHSASSYVRDRVQPYLSLYSVSRYKLSPQELIRPEPAESPGGVLQWSPFFCMKAWFDEESKYLDTCEQPSTSPITAGTNPNEKGIVDMRDFRILMQLSMDGLYNNCSQLKDEPTTHRHCLRAMKDNANPPQIVDRKTIRDGSNWRQCRVCTESKENKCSKKNTEKRTCSCKCNRKAEDEEDLSYTLRRLKELQFHYRDLGLEREEAHRSVVAMKTVLLRLLDDVAAKQSRSRGMTLKVIGKPALNFLSYTPPPYIFYLMLGNGFEFTYSGTSKAHSWLRFNITMFELEGLNALIGGEGAVSFTPALGVELELLPLSSALFQSRLAIRAGYQLSTSGGFTAETCEATTSNTSNIHCSFPVFQSFYSVSFYERVRAQIGIEWAPPMFDDLPPSNQHWFSTILGIGWQWI